MKDVENIQRALDALALALPKDFHWPKPMRSSYEQACRSLTRMAAQLQAKRP